MKVKVTAPVLCFLAIIALVTPVQLLAQSTAVLEVVEVDAHGKNAAYLEALKPVMTRIKELSPEVTIRIWEKRYSGPGFGTLIVGITYPSMAYFADSQAKSEGDSKLQAAMANLESTGRTIVARSLLREVTP